MKIFFKNIFLNTKGFTLVEVMISVGLFVTVMLIGVGAVLNTNVSHKRTLAVRQVLDSLNFLIEDMARNIRLGSNYNCIIDSPIDFFESSGIVQFNSSIKNPQDCLDGLSIAFEPQGGLALDDNDQMAYIIEGNIDSATIKKISNVGGVSIVRDIRPTGFSEDASLFIDPRQSGFSVFGSLPFPNDISSFDPSLNDTIQPRVIIRLSGYIDYKDKRVPFSVQTTVTQRLIDS